MFFPLFCLAQKADEELAAQYIANKEFDKAADMYERLLAKNPKSVYFYDNLFKCYTSLGNYNDAVSVAKKQQRRFEYNYYFLVDEGYALTLKKESDKATVIFKQIINRVIAAEPKIRELASAFYKRGLNEYAIQTYIQGRKLLKNNLYFCTELAGLYTDLGDKQNAIEEYLNALLADNEQIELVQGYLQNYLSTSADDELLKQALLKRNRLYANNDVYMDMLIWFYVQQIDFNNALIYAKALDKRYREQGKRIIELGILALSNKKYNEAINIFKQVVAIGKDNPFYAYAKNLIADAQGKKLLDGTYTQDDLIALNKQYHLLIEEFGYTPYMVQTIKELARLQAYYLNKPDSALIYLDRIIHIYGIDPKIMAETKLELGDLYVYKNEVWEAMLLYGQVDNEFKEEPLGQEAKLRNARLSYFIGEFDWARIQLDVLKTATTQLISNNAIELSLLIQDNTIDSNEEPLKWYAKADLNYFQKNYYAALKQLDSIEVMYPKHDIIDEILYKRAQIYSSLNDYQNALKYFNMVFSEHGSGIFGDNALFESAQILQFKLNKPDEALKFYEKFIDTYSGSFYLNEVRKQFRILRGDKLN